MADGNTFHFVHAAYCWIRKVESACTRFRHVGLNQSMGCEVRDSYFHHSFNYGDVGNAYGIDELEQAGLADYWGPSGPGNTLFRNFVTLDGICYQDNSHHKVGMRTIDRFKKTT